jgi:hypothetical protein
MGRYSGTSSTSKSKPTDGHLVWNAEVGNFLLTMKDKRFIVSKFAGITLHTDLFRVGGRTFDKKTKWSSSYGSYKQGQKRITIWKNVVGTDKGEVYYTGSYKDLKNSGLPNGSKFQTIIVLALPHLFAAETDEDLKPVGAAKNIADSPMIVELTLHGMAQMVAWGNMLKGRGIDSSEADGFKIKWGGDTIAYDAAGKTFKAPLIEVFEVGQNESDKALDAIARTKYEIFQDWLDYHWSNNSQDDFSEAEEAFPQRTENKQEARRAEEKTLQPDEDLPF